MTRMWDELANGTTIVHRRASRGRRRRRCGSSARRASRWPPASRRSGRSCSRIPTSSAPTSPSLRVGAHRRRARSRPTSCARCARRSAARSSPATRAPRRASPRARSSDDDDEIVATTVGRPAPEVELRIVDPRDGSEQLPAGEVGEVRLPVAGDDARLLARPRAHRRRSIDADGWLHTGDLGFVGADGNLRIVGRLKEMYIRGGYNVYPAEVEAVLADHPSVARAAVVGAPDPVLGEVGVRVRRAAPADPPPPTRRPCGSWCRDRVADYKAPDRVVVVDELPLTSMLKIDKRALAARGQRRGHDHGVSRSSPSARGDTQREADQARWRAVHDGRAAPGPRGRVQPLVRARPLLRRLHDRRRGPSPAPASSRRAACKEKRYPADSPITPGPDDRFVPRDLLDPRRQVRRVDPVGHQPGQLAPRQRPDVRRSATTSTR